MAITPDPRAESRFQGNHRVAGDFDFLARYPGNQLFENAADLRGGLGPSRARRANTDGADLTGRDLGGDARLANGSMQSFRACCSPRRTMLLPPVIAFASTVVSSARTQRVLVPPPSIPR